MSYFGPTPIKLLKRHIVIGVIAILFLLVVESCQTPFEREEFVGTWRFGAESRIFLEKKPFVGLKPWFELKQDGTFVAVDLPQSSFFVRGQWQNFIMRGHGTWELGTHQDRPIVRLNFQELENYAYKHTPEDIERKTGYGFLVYIYHSRSDFYLFYYDDDPDMAREMRFRKENPGPGRTERRD